MITITNSQIAYVLDSPFHASISSTTSFSFTEDHVSHTGTGASKLFWVVEINSHSKKLDPGRTDNYCDISVSFIEMSKWAEIPIFVF